MASGRALFVPCAALVLLGATACKQPQQRQGRAPVTVAVTPARRMAVPYTIEANGVVTPLASASVASQVDGIIQAVLFEEGKEVTKGQLLFRIDPRPYQNAYQQALGTLARDQAAADYADSAFQRYDKLFKAKVVTQDDYESKRAAAAGTRAVLLSDSAAVATAKFNLDNTTVRAPISGRTGGLLVKPGNLVRAAGGAPLVLINQVRPIYVRFAVPGSQLPLIQHYGGSGGLPVTASPSAAVAPTAPSAGTPVTPLDASLQTSPQQTQVNLGKDGAIAPTVGSLTFIDNAVDTTTGTVQLKARFDNKTGNLWAGQFVATSLQLFVEDSAIVVPSQCVVSGQRGTFVYIVDSANTAQQRPVTVERSTNGMSIIASGVSVGDRVVTDGQSRLSPGAPVDLRSGREGGGGGRVGRGGGRGGGRAGGGRNGGRGGDARGDAAPKAGGNKTP